METADVALQLYTLRKEMAADFRGTLRTVAAIGYQAVELAGTGGLSAEELRDLLQELHLEAASAHVGLTSLQEDLEGIVRYHRTIGCSFITVPSLPPADRNDAEAVRRVAHTLDALAVRLHQAGITLAYHNHDFEYQRLGDRTILEILYGETAHLKAELDVYWSHKGGDDPAKRIRQLGERCALLHLKDITRDGDFAEVGEGVLDFAPILAAGKAVGVRWYIVEQDRCARPSIEAVALSLKNLRSMRTSNKPESSAERT